MSFESIVDRVKSIPPLPESVMKIEKLFLQRDPDFDELVKIVEEDPVLTADILAIANSPLYAFSKTVVSVKQAITLFGMHTIRGFVLKSITDKSFKFDLSPYGISNEGFKKMASLQSLLMFQWYMSIDVEEASRLVPIAFLMDIGKIIVANEVSQSDYKDEFTRMITEDNSLRNAEELFVGVSSTKVTAMLFKHWNFNEIFSDVVRYSDTPLEAEPNYIHLSKAVNVVKTSINVQEILTESSIAQALQKAREFDMDIDKLARTTKRIARILE